MPRGPRLDYPDALHHVMVRGIARKYIFKFDEDKQVFMDFFAQALKRSGCRCYAWALMGNHAHFLLRSGEKGLASLMRSVLTRYALYYNRKHQRSGHLFQNRYKSILVQDDAYFKKLIAYIHGNPLKAKIVPHLKKLASYRWSGHAELMGHGGAGWLEKDAALRSFGSTLNEVKAAYLQAVKFEIKQKDGYLDGGGLVVSAGGKKAVAQLQKDGQRWAFDERVLGNGEFVLQATARARKSMDAVAALRQHGLTERDLAKRLRRIYGLATGFFLRHGKDDAISRARASYARLTTEILGLSRAQAARQLGITRAALGKAIFRTELDTGYDAVRLACLGA